MAAISNLSNSRPRPLFRATAINGRIACDDNTTIELMTCDLWTMKSDRIRAASAADWKMTHAKSASTCASNRSSLHAGGGSRRGDSDARGQHEPPGRRRHHLDRVVDRRRPLGGHRQRGPGRTHRHR